MRASSAVRPPPSVPVVLLPLAALSLALPLVVPAPLAAQEGATFVRFWAGIPTPGEDLSRVVDSGFEVGAGFDRRLTRRLSALVLLGRTFLDPTAEEGPGQPELGPPVVLWHYTVGLELELTEPAGLRTRGNPWEVAINGGVGGATWDVKRSRAGSQEFLEQSTLRNTNIDTNPAATAGLRVGPDLTDFASLYYQLQIYFSFGDTGDRDGFLGKETLYTNVFGFRLMF